MVLSKAELVTSLQHEVSVLLHLASKIDRMQVDFRPTPTQRSTIELLRYLTVQGPVLVESAKAGAFDGAAWGAAQGQANTLDVDGLCAVIATQRDQYAAQLADVTDADMAAQIEMFGSQSSRGAFLVNIVLANHIAYRTQLFMYLKLCGREELNTANLWRGMDAPPRA